MGRTLAFLLQGTPVGAFLAVRSAKKNRPLFKQVVAGVRNAMALTQKGQGFRRESLRERTGSKAVGNPVKTWVEKWLAGRPEWLAPSNGRHLKTRGFFPVSF